MIRVCKFCPVMSVGYSLLRENQRQRVRDAWERLYGVLFGDRIGCTLFLGSLLFLALYWRVGVFITDTWTVANTVVAVSEGHLYIDRIVYGPGPNTPGMHLVERRLYGRNFGHVFISLPFVWLLEGLSRVGDLRVVIIGLWSLSFLAFASNLGSLFGRPRLGVWVGALGATVMFTANVVLATPLSTRWIHLIALQLSTIVATAFVGVVLYRLIARMYNRQHGTFIGSAVVLATPLAFWASIPKRHAVTALLFVLIIYSFYRSRETWATHTQYRALAYVWVGLLAWVMAPEALALFLSLLAVDLLTARSNHFRVVIVVGGAFLLALVPFFITNYLIVGNPLTPPRLLPRYGGGARITFPVLGETGGIGGVFGGSSGPSGGSGSDIGAGSTGSGSGSGGIILLPPGFGALIASTVGKFTIFGSLFTRGLSVIATEPNRLYHTFVHSGYIEQVASWDGQQAINLAFLESMPLLSTLLASAGPLRYAFPDRTKRKEWLASPGGQTDLLVVTSMLLFTLIYLKSLPTHAMVTVRYLVPTIPGLLYIIARLYPVRRALHNPKPLLWAYVATVLVGGQLVVIYLALIDPGLGEAVQLHALLGLATAVPLGLWAIHDSLRNPGYPRVGAICLGLAAGVTTVFLLLSGIDYFSYAGDFAIPVVQRLSQALSLVN